MRSLKKLLEKIYRKSALALVRRGDAGLPGADAATSAASAASSSTAAPGDTAPAPADAAASDSAAASDGTAAATVAADEAASGAADTEVAVLAPGGAASQESCGLPVAPAEGSVVSATDGAADGAAAADGAPAADSEAIPEWKGEPIVVDAKDLTDYVGQPPFTSDRIYQRTPAGERPLDQRRSLLVSPGNAKKLSQPSARQSAWTTAPMPAADAVSRCCQETSQ